jgi:hypothetical protein
MDDQRTDREVSGVRYRKLRIAWSVGWGLAAVLLIVLWMRSYSSRHFAYVRMLYHYVECSSSRGRVGLQILGPHFGPGAMSIKWDARTIAIDSRYGVFTDLSESGFMSSIGTLRMGPGVRLRHWQFGTPCWFVIGVCISAFAIPWLRLRFNLRTLLIATTLVAVVLGLVVWAARK